MQGQQPGGPEHIATLSARAEKKWNHLDRDQSGELEGEEILALAEWVWCSFRPGQEITPQHRRKEAEKILDRCDKDGNGVVDKGEFQVYYDKTAGAMFK